MWRQRRPPSRSSCSPSVPPWSYAVSASAPPSPEDVLAGLAWHCRRGSDVAARVGAAVDVRCVFTHAASIVMTGRADARQLPSDVAPHPAEFCQLGRCAFSRSARP